MRGKKYKDIEFTLHAILVGILLNGYIQGNDNKELNASVIKEALKDIKKILQKNANNL